MASIAKPQTTIPTKEASPAQAMTADCTTVFKSSEIQHERLNYLVTFCHIEIVVKSTLLTIDSFSPLRRLLSSSSAMLGDAEGAGVVVVAVVVFVVVVVVGSAGCNQQFFLCVSSVFSPK